EQYRQRIVAQATDIDVEAAVTSKCHLRQCYKQATVTAVVIGKEIISREAVLHRLKEGFQLRSVIKVRRAVAELVVNLSQNRTTKAVFTVAQIQQQQIGRTFIGTQLGRQCFAHIHNRGKRRNNQRQGRGHRLFNTVFLP